MLARVRGRGEEPPTEHIVGSSALNECLLAAHSMSLIFLNWELVKILGGSLAVSDIHHHYF